MSNIIACRIASYGQYQGRGWSHLPELGILFVEIPAPSPADLPAVRARLKTHGLVASSLQATCDMTQTDAVDRIRPQLEACPELGARVCFLSAKAGETDRNAIWDRLRAIGDLAGKLDLTVALETHPDLVTNGDQALETMRAVNHPRVRVNFDTANIYYYNQNRTAVDELQKITEYVAAVHLKDTTGGYQTWDFPALGRGVVDFPRVFALLNYRGFRGPFTIELEGTRGTVRSEAEQLAYVEESVHYLKRIAAFGAEP